MPTENNVHYLSDIRITQEHKCPEDTSSISSVLDQQKKVPTSVIKKKHVIQEILQERLSHHAVLCKFTPKVTGSSTQTTQVHDITVTSFCIRYPFYHVYEYNCLKTQQFHILIWWNICIL